MAGSILLHVVFLLVLLHARPDLKPSPPSTDEEVSIVFDHPAGSTTSSTLSETPISTASVASGNPDAPVDKPSIDTSLAAPPPGPVVASAEPPAQVSPPAETVPPPAPESPLPTVSLSTDTGLPPPPAFVMPQPPASLPPLPQPAPSRPTTPRVVARPQPRSASPFSSPQDWSFNRPSRAPGQASRGMDFSLAPRGGKSEQSELEWVAGAHPSGGWGAEFHNWAQARVYYPEAARVNGVSGTATVLLEIDRSGKVLSVRLAKSSDSPFLDGAWIDIFRNARVPAFTPDMTEPTITLRATLVYRLIRR